MPTRLVGLALHCLSCSVLPGRSGSQHFQCSAIPAPSSYSLLFCLFAHLSVRTSRIGLLRIGPLGSDSADRILSARAPSACPLGSAPFGSASFGSAHLARPPRLQSLGSAPLCSAPFCSAPLGSVPLGSKSSHRTSSARLSSARKPSAASAFGCSHSLPVYRSNTPAHGAWLSRLLAALAMDYFSALLLGFLSACPIWRSTTETPGQVLTSAALVLRCPASCCAGPFT